MTRDELLAAADTVVQAAHDYPGDEWLSQKVVTAADELATHIQRLYDPTPVDEDWWKSVAGKAAFKHDVFSLEFKKSSVEVWCMYHLVLRASTRGDVRRLCDTFGIELREEP